jgi:hypothetical protein
MSATYWLNDIVIYLGAPPGRLGDLIVTKEGALQLGRSLLTRLADPEIQHSNPSHRL